MYKFLFGPVPSRRLGMSLGVDLVPLKKYVRLIVFIVKLEKQQN